MTDSCPTPPSLTRNGFQIRGRSFTTKDTRVERMDGSLMRNLLFPVKFFHKEDQIAHAKKARKTLTKEFLAAQLRFYGVHFRMSAKMAELRNLLEDAVESGKCDRVPDAVADLEQSMRREYEPMYQEWRRKRRAWEERKKQQEAEAAARQRKEHEEAFARCKTLSEKASFDFSLFLEHYFLTDGKPNPAKAPEPMTVRMEHRTWVRAFTSPHGDPHQLARQVGLHAALSADCRKPLPFNSGPRKYYRLRIGHDHAVVERFAHEIVAQEEAAAQKKRDDDYDHCVARARRRNLRSFDLRQCIGSYVVECDKVVRFSKDYKDAVLTMDISPAGSETLVAAFDFGLVQGTMLLSLSEENLDAMVGAVSSARYDNTEDEVDDDPDDPWASIYPAYSTDERRKQTLAQAVASKQARGGNDGSAAGASKKGGGSIKKSSHNAPRKKRRIIMPSLSRRVHYRLRGQETLQGEIYPDPEAGHLDFLSNGCEKFMGLAYLFPGLDSNVRFTGYKVAEQPRRKPEPWSTFDDEAAGCANRARWK
ncbi:hypothetical protein IWZ01DRAFT_317521 [Phyllosticta capitalensis]